MFFTRFATFCLFLASFGILAQAKPISTGVAVSDNFGKSIDARTYPAVACGCGQDLVDVLANLKVEIDVQVALLDGVASPIAPCNSIIASIKAATTVIANIDLKVAFVEVDIHACVSILVEIILALIACCSKYSLAVILDLCLEISAALAVCITACIHLCPAILVGIVANVDIIASTPLLSIHGFAGVLSALGIRI